MINYQIKSILLISILVLGFSGNVDMFEKYDKSISNIFHGEPIMPIQLAFAESDGEKDSGSSDKSSEQDNSNNIHGNESPYSNEHQSENNGLQFNESNQTQTMHEGENKDKKELDQENNNNTSEHQQELDQKSEIENENNNVNATHKVTEHDLSSIQSAKTNETIAAEVNVGMGNVDHKSIDSNVTVKTENFTNDSVAITVNASSGTGPKVILINLNSTTIDVANVKYLHVMYDGQLITPAANVDEILHTTSSDQPHYAILITQSGAQILVSIPHFSTHTITLDSLSKVMPTVPEFPLSVIAVFALMITTTIAIARKRLNLFT
ncbi:MAG: hypothetical protein KGI05_07440 [Thaumarchaeota archaeon]|nr:hypothetical protein [Nitrososphaerota archaeon]